MAFKSLALLTVAAVPVLAADGLNIRAKAAGKLYFGTATDNGELSDSEYLAQLSNTSDFGQLTPGNSQKWDTIEPSQGTFSYTNGDAIVDLAEENGQIMRCHNLVWHSQLPSWVSSGGFDNETLIEVMTNHITNEVTHYKGECYAWDVVNEGLNDDGTYRSDVFYDTIGEAYFPIAFAAAAAADPDAKLYYNDYNIETAGAKSTAAQNLVTLIQSYGAKIDGVGLQAHLIVGSVSSASAMQTNLEAFVDLGVEVAYTELDIRTDDPATDAELTQQATDYSNVITACKNVAECVGVTIWDWTDKYSWIPGVFDGEGEALPWDDNYEYKPAYWAILSAWGDASNTSTTSGTSATATTLSTTTTKATATTTKASTATSASSTVTSATATATGAALYGQCGGSGWTGPTTCAQGTCTKQNDYYSQCL